MNLGPQPSLKAVSAALPPADQARLELTYCFAAQAHEGQLRDEGTPFIEHPLRVALILATELNCRDADVLAAALCHDVLEDCPQIDDAQLTAVIGERACGMVRDVTKRPVPEEQQAERDRAYMDALPGLTYESRLLKLADRIDNLRSVTLSGDLDKMRRYLEVSRAEFRPLAAQTNPTTELLVMQACDAVAFTLAKMRTATGPPR